MLKKSHRGTFQICIDLELDADRASLSEHRALCELAGRLVYALDQHRLSATFSVQQPALLSASAPILASDGEHEIALLADSSWVTPGATRAELLDELRLRLAAARAANIQVSTILVRDADLGPMWDALHKCGITAVCGPPPAGIRSRRVRRPIAPKRGVWALPTTVQFPAPLRFLGSWDVGFRGKQALKRCLSHHAFEQLRVNCCQILKQERAAVRAFGRILRIAAALRDAGRIEISNVRNGCAAVAQDRSYPSDSILRKAA